MTKIVHIKRIPISGGFYAINILGVIFSTGPLSPVDLNHERIHTVQQRELLFVFFYLWYVIEWAVLWLKYRDHVKAYFHIRFEKEAYRHEADLTYLKHRRHFHYS